MNISVKLYSIMQDNISALTRRATAQARKGLSTFKLGKKDMVQGNKMATDIFL